MSSVGRSLCDHDDDVMDEDDDEENEPTTMKSGNDTCLASHEFEWLDPTSLNIGERFTNDKCSVPLESKQGIGRDLSERSNIRLTSPPGNANYQCKRLSAFCPKQQPAVADYRLSPSPCWGGHGYYHLSPVRSSWCCPSPPPTPIVPMCCHHGGGPSTEVIPYSEVCDDSAGYPCCSYPPPIPVPPPHMHSDLHLFHHHTSARSGGKESPAPRSSPETRPSSRRSRSSGSKRRDYSPIPYSITNDPTSPQLLPLPPRNFAERNKGSLKEYENNVQKISQLENDKKNLSLQVTVLTCQVEAQSEKIAELETVLSEMKAQTKHTEHLLQQEMLTRSTIENSKTLLMSEVANLKLKLSGAEKERKFSDDRCRKIESDVLLLQSHLTQKEAELAALRNTFSQHEITLTSGNKCAEAEDLRFTLGSVTSLDEQKGNKNEDPKLSQTKCKILQDYALPEHSKKVFDHSVGDASFSNFGASHESDLSTSAINEGIMFQKDNLLKKQHQVPRSVVPVTSTPIETDVSVLSWKESVLTQNSTSANDRFSPLNSSYRSSSEENICVASSKVPQTSSRYGTIPRQSSLQESQQYLERSIHPEIEGRRSASKNAASEGKSFTGVEPSNVLGLNISTEKKETASKQSHSTRNKSSGVSFAQEEPVTIPNTEIASASRTTTPSPIPSPLLIRSDKDKSKGFLKFLNKWKRSGSQNLEKLEGNFRRGEMRATAGPRLGWSPDAYPQTSLPFPQWNTDLLVDWLNRIGLSMCISECRKWGCSGEKLLKATPHELEKELGLKNALHKKKLMLALKSMNSELSDLPASINKLDYHWVIRWLDDVGLPQYKDSFADSRVDGRVLHFLTVDDLAYLKVTNHLHHVSIKRGIQVLREKKFDSHCLIRRSMPDESKTYSPELVSLWTNHRVMEWLRTVDLSEYAPNLRGSGVHGALIVYEPKFNADVFASLLNIPPTKTLLRRHLATHFKLVVGDDLTQQKKDVEIDPAYVPLTPSLKIKATRKGQFSTKKKKGKKGDVESEEYICPLDLPEKEPVFSKMGNTKLIVRRNSDPVAQEQRAFDLQAQKAAEEIGVVSKEITSLTSSLHKEDLLKHSETTDV